MNNNRYKATFEVPALVRIEIEVDADNQQDGLVLAHDLIHQALPTQATVMSLRLEQATNTAFERIEAAPVLPPSPLEINGRYRVQLFRDDNQGDVPAHESGMLAYGDAKQLAETVLNDDSRYGSARVIDEFNFVVLRTKAPRSACFKPKRPAMGARTSAKLRCNCASLSWACPASTVPWSWRTSAAWFPTCCRAMAPCASKSS